MRADRLALLVHGCALGAAAVTFAGCSWFTDFKRQPKIDPWEVAVVADSGVKPEALLRYPFRGNPQRSVPISGTSVAGYQVSYNALPGTIDSMSPIPNPTPVSDSSLANGRRYFQINCVPCHGPAGKGNGLATLYGMPGIGLTSDVTRNRSDGYIFGMIRNGRGLMPSYDRIEELDRWDVVNYVRGLQGRLATAVDTTLPGLPGQTGTALPGRTRMGPTRPVPYSHPNGTTDLETMRQPSTAAATPASGAVGGAAGPAPRAQGFTP